MLKLLLSGHATECLLQLRSEGLRAEFDGNRTFDIFVDGVTCRVTRPLR